MNNITLQVGVIEQAISALQLALGQGEKFGQAMLDSLVNDWSADRAK